ncbi:MAG: right-handed parallel beta-helix repeat-containing protein, partial [Marmoricola sp.]
EGSGVSADDVVVEAGSVKAGDGGPSAVGHAKDVGLFVDRADGFVMRDMTFRHAREHDIYILETDGYLFDRFKAFYAGGYGVLTFVEDHGMIENCDAAGNGDSGIYPGAGADSTDKRYLPFYPTYRFSQTVQYCDSHHNDGGFSGTDSHGTLVQHNNFYDNALGYTTDVFTAPGHPGFPQHGNVVRYNNFYSNNFDVYATNSDVAPFVGSPVGTGLWLAGGNANQVYGNHFYDNWRRGMMLFAVPDATVCGPPPVGSSTPVPGCNPLGVSTSYDNLIHNNVMGMSPQGAVRPNGTDFWWDAFLGNTGNCWWGNSAAPGKTVTTSPAMLPDCAGGTNPALSIGTGDPVNEAELVACLAGFDISGYPNGNSTICPWSTTPPKPGGAAAPVQTSAAMSAGQSQELAEICASGLAPRLCAGATDVLSTLWGEVQDLSVTLRSPVLTATPVYTPGRLSLFTCDWWRQANADQKLGMINRIQHFATMPINGSSGDQLLGYGAGMSANRAALFFEDRCSMFEAGSFALYKLYGAAAAFSAVAPQ